MPTNPLGQIACAEWDRRLRSNLQNNELARLFLNQGVVGSRWAGGARKAYREFGTLSFTNSQIGFLNYQEAYPLCDS
ncbi:MAG: hypothetical protein IKV97_02410 [Clostridia bacterium]|nr:hypothetical protein [Clostridia bacterium]